MGLLNDDYVASFGAKKNKIYATWQHFFLSQQHSQWVMDISKARINDLLFLFAIGASKDIRVHCSEVVL